MEHTDWTIKDRPFDLRERLFLFACIVVRLAQFLNTRGPVAAALSTQVVKAAVSAGANYEEADSGSSDRDRLAKTKIVLRELKETRFRLRVLRQTDLLRPEHDAVIQEALELMRITARVVRNLEDKLATPPTPRRTDV